MHRTNFALRVIAQGSDIMNSVFEGGNDGTMALELPANVVVALKKEARRSHSSVSTLAARAVADFLEDREDYRDAVAAKKQSGKNIPAQEVFRRLGLEG